VIGRITSVRAISAHIKELFAYDDALANIWIEGEVANAKTYSSGHFYFSLIEENAKLDCVLFRREAAQQRFLPRDGARYALHGKIDAYESRSCYQLIVDLVQPAGIGLQALELEQLRQRLAAEGLFEPSRKRPLPAFPLAIGVVTSGDGAVWHDIQNVLRRRYPLAHVILSPSLVQGPAAPASMIAALRDLQDDGRAEVIILARGGGSADDLAAFNDEALARAIFAARVPVVSAVGHESDWSITDDVADLRAPTPSAAAELVSPSVDDLRFTVHFLRDRLSRAASTEVRHAQQALDSVEARLRRWSPEANRRAKHEQIAMLRRRMDAAMIRPSIERRRAVAATWMNVARASQLGLAQRHQSVERNRLLLEALEVRSVLQRGFSVLTRSGSDEPVRSWRGVRPDEALRAHLADGELDLAVKTARQQ
jgi:exodeoxyribonuclease VII large subunit